MKSIFDVSTVLVLFMMRTLCEGKFYLIEDGAKKVANQSTGHDYKTMFFEGIEDSCSCGKPPSGSRDYIFAGSEQDSNLPWMAKLITRKKTGSFLCGGTLISSTYVLTAAHCLVNTTKPTIVVFASTKLLRSHDLDNKDIIVMKTSKYKIHPSYRERKSPIHYIGSKRKYHNDMALIKLPRKVPFSEKVFPICMEFEYHLNEVLNGTIAGWGRVDGKSLSPDLKTASVSFSLDLIRGFVYIVKPIGNNSGIACEGDSGGPLTVTSFSRATLMGVASTNEGGCNLNNGTYNLYSCVPFYLHWLDDETKDDPPTNALCVPLNEYSDYILDY